MLEGNSLNQPAPPRGFKALLVTMTCGAVNDNLLRGALLLSVAEGGMWGGKLGEGGTGWITVMLYLPFVLLLGVTGQMADRYSKRTIIVWTRIAEVLLAAGVAIAFWFGSFYVTTALFVLLAAQSAFFSPAKYGSVPELVPDARLGWANGLLSLLTNAAIILGVAAAGIMLGAGPVFLGLSMIGVAIIGLISSIQIASQPAADPTLSLSMRTFTAHLRVIHRMRGTPLLSTTLAWCWFYAVGSLVITIIPLLREPMELSDAAAGALLAAPGLGIGIGGLVAGVLSRTGILASLIPIGAIGMTVTFVLLAIMPESWMTSIILLGIVGFFAGFYVVPILALLQHMPVPSFRARTVGTANFMTYIAMMASALGFAVLAPVIGDDPHLWFSICAGGMLLVFIGAMLQRTTMRAAAAPELFATIGGEV
jgi:acyl-[acyl-carrier-protein]-phospholipid O-acyltransferase/long-chain-fatty-acid--[acyl-carrier-protein] ligase